MLYICEIKNKSLSQCTSRDSKWSGKLYAIYGLALWFAEIFISLRRLSRKNLNKRYAFILEWVKLMVNLRWPDTINKRFSINNSFAVI